MPTLNSISLLKIGTLFLLGLLFVVSCDENAEKTTTKKNVNQYSKRIYNAQFNIKDSGYQTIVLRSPLVEMYEFVDTPYTIFPKGFNLNFYKKDEKNPGFLRASFAKIIELKGWYEAKGNVILINPDGDTLKTQRLFWNKKTQLVISRDTVFILRKDSTKLTAINGLEATDDFKVFKLFNNKGPVYVKSK